MNDQPPSAEAVKAAFAWADARTGGYTPEKLSALMTTDEAIDTHREDFESGDRAVIRILAAHARARDSEVARLREDLESVQLLPDAPMMPPNPLDFLPKLPPLPEGFDRWEDRGLGWDNGRRECVFAHVNISTPGDSWWVQTTGSPIGNGECPSLHYIEAMKDSPAVPAQGGGGGFTGPVIGTYELDDQSGSLKRVKPPSPDTRLGDTPRTDSLEAEYLGHPLGCTVLEHARTLERELALSRDAVGNWKRAFLRVKAREDDETHFWQGDGEDHLESLVCPILIDPQQLQEIFAELTAAQQDSRRLDHALILMNKYLTEIGSTASWTRAGIDRAMEGGEG